MAVVINVNAVQQQTESEALTGKTNTIIPANAGVNQGVASAGKALNTKNIVSTGGLFIAASIGKQAFSMVTSNVGRVSGNSHLQNQVNTNLKLAATAVGLFTHPVITGIALAADGINYAIDTYFTERNDRVKSAQAQAIAGTVRGRKR